MEKKFLYGGMALSTVVGSAFVIQQTAHAQFVGGTQIGNINIAPIIQTGIRDMSSPEFQTLVDSIVQNKSLNHIRYVVSNVGWTDQSQVVGDNVITLNETATLSSPLRRNLGREGFNLQDKGVFGLLPDEMIGITNVGTIRDLETNTDIPVHLRVTYKGNTHGNDGMPRTHKDYQRVNLFAKNQSGVITLGFTTWAVEGASGTGGRGESGSVSSGGSYTGRANGYIQDVTFVTEIIRADTGERLDDDKTIMAMKVSDVDAKQLATVQDNDVFAYIVSNDTKLQQSGGGFVSSSNGAVNEDTKELSENSYILLRQGNEASIQFGYTRSEQDNLNIVAGLFGNTHFEVNVDGHGTLVIQKTGTDSQTPLTSDYSLAGAIFQATHTETGQVYELETDETGRAVKSDMPFGNYTVKEIKAPKGYTLSDEQFTVSLTRETPKQTINSVEDQVVNLSVKNKEDYGVIRIEKTGLNTGLNMLNSLYSLAGNKFRITHLETNKTVDVVSDGSGIALAEGLAWGRYRVEEIESSKGFKKTFITQEVTLLSDQPTVEFKGVQEQVTTVTGTNEEYYGIVKLVKTGERSGTRMWNKHYTLAHNTFTLTHQETKQVFTIRTNAEGLTEQVRMPLGNYDVVETKSSNGFINTFKSQVVRLDQNGELVLTVKGTNKEITGQNTLVKLDKDTEKVAQGQAKLHTAQYGLFYAEDDGVHKAGEPVKWTGQVDVTPTLLKGTRVNNAVISGQFVDFGDNIVVDVDDETLEASVGNLYLGKYYWQEVNAPEGYVIDTTKHHFELTKLDDKTETIIAPEVKSLETVLKANINIQKILQASGDLSSSGFNGIQFKVTPIDDTNTEEQVITTDIKDDEDGYASMSLVYGDYVITEVNVPDGYKAIEPIYIHMTTDITTDEITITASHQKDGSQPFSRRTFLQSDTPEAQKQVGQSGVVTEDKPFISLSKLTLKDNPDNDDFEPKKYVLNASGFDLMGTKLLDDDNELKDSVGETNTNPYVDKKDNNESENINTDWLFTGDKVYYQVWLDTTNFDSDDKFSYLGIEDTLSRYVDVKVEDVRVYDKQTGNDVSELFDVSLVENNLSVRVNDNGKTAGVVAIDFGRYYVVEIPGTIALSTPANTDVENVARQIVERFVEPTTPGTTTPNKSTRREKLTQKRVNKVKEKPLVFQPEKYVLRESSFDLMGIKLLDDDNELSDKYTETNTNPYVDKKDNNEVENINTDVLKRGDKVYYQVWLDTTKFTEDDKLSVLGITDTYSEHFVLDSLNAIKVYDKQTGQDVTEKFDVSNDNQTLTVEVNAQGKTNGVVSIDFGRYYVIELPGKISEHAPAGEDIENVASQFVARVTDSSVTSNGTTTSEENPVNTGNDGNTTTGGNPINNGNRPSNTVEKVTQKRVNKVKDPEFNPQKYVLNANGFDLVGTKLLDDDNELSDVINETSENPYVDTVDNNEAENINTKEVSRSEQLTYQLWMDTTSYLAIDKVNEFGMIDSFDTEHLVVGEQPEVVVYDSVDGKDVSEYFSLSIENGELVVKTNETALKEIQVGDKVVQVIDTEKLPLGRYYKVDFKVTVKEDVADGTDIKNVARQFVSILDKNGEPKRTEKSTQTRVNKVKVPTTSEEPKPTPKEKLPQTGSEQSGLFVVGVVALIGSVVVMFREKIVVFVKKVVKK